ncbi:APC family permease [Kocuria sp. LUK]|uniref:APC family permease n=1 Tax=Kocuria sp. LUK TaxID=2897828 RepID=UPI001E494B22|nr:APC family permease [Kocuria sp. LUK]MCD1145690.1 APC family permease [Kocuria sp. LUK]
MNDQSADGTGLRRRITGPLLFLFILGDVLGAGVYALVGAIAGEVGGVTWAPMLLALLLALLTAASYAELVTKYPRAGGAAVFAARAFGSQAVSYLVGFCMLAAGIVSASALALAFSGDYLVAFVEVPPALGAVVFLLAVAALNARGIKESLRANVVMTAVEVSGLVLVVVAVALLVGAGGGDLGRAVRFGEGVDPLTGVLGAALLAYYSFVGFETSANVAEEIRDPSRVYPRALFGALVAAGVMYVLVGTAASVALPAQELGASSAPLLDVVAATGVPVPPWLFSLLALVAVANGALLTMIMASRLTYGMAAEGLFPAVLGRVQPGRGTPWVAIAATTAAAVLLTLTGGVVVLAETVVLLLLVVFLSTNTAVLVLRRDAVAHRHFRVWAPVPVLAVLSCLVLLTQLETAVWLRGGVVLAVGVLLHVVGRRGGRRAPAADRAVARRG